MILLHTSFNCLLGQTIEMILMKIEDKTAVKDTVDNLSVDALDERGLGQFRVEMVIQAPSAGWDLHRASYKQWVLYT